MDFFKEYGRFSNFVFIGETGSGKSELAMNVALLLAEAGAKPVYMFDLDMTKPIFRSRDREAILKASGVHVQYEIQFMDAPTTTGGVEHVLKDRGCFGVLDVGGDHIGARSIGGYAPFLNRDDCCVFYVVNSYRSWSADIGHIDGVLSQVLGASHIQMQHITFVGNPNLGPETTAEEFIQGRLRLEQSMGAYVSIAFYCARKPICGDPGVGQKVLPLRLQMGYEWQENIALKL